MKPSEDCYFNLRISVMATVVVSIVYTIIYGVYFYYSVGFIRNSVLLVNLVPIGFLVFGLTRNDTMDGRIVVMSIMYTVINIVLANVLIFLTMFALFFMGII